MKCNRNKLAKIIGHDVKTSDKMVRDGMPYLRRPGEGSRVWEFDTGAVIRWLCNDDSVERARRTAKARSKLAGAKAGLRWLEYGEALGFLERIDDIIPVFEEAMHLVKSRMLALPGRLDQLAAIETDPAVIERMLQHEVDDIHAQLDRMTAQAGEPKPGHVCGRVEGKAVEGRVTPVIRSWSLPVAREISEIA